MHQGIVYSQAVPTIIWAKIYAGHKNLKSKEVCKEET